MDPARFCGHRHRSEPARPISIGSSSPAVPCNKIFGDAPPRRSSSFAVAPAVALRVPDNITLLPLPPYSPELNPVENLWQFLKHNFLNTRVFDSYDAIVTACCDAWTRLRAIPGQIRSITTRDWAKAVNL